MKLLALSASTAPAALLLVLLGGFINFHLGSADCVLSNTMNTTDTDVLVDGSDFLIDCSSGQYNVATWLFGDTALPSVFAACPEGNTVAYVPTSNGTLTICRAGVLAAGAYKLLVNGTVRQEVHLYSAPKAVLNPVNTDLFQGGTAPMSCVVEGFPLPEIVWVQKNISVPAGNGSRFEVLFENRTRYTATSQLTISDAQYSDRSNGPFSCVSVNRRFGVSGSIVGRNETAGALFRVRDPLGALWPFLGLVAQAVFLLIVLYLDQRYRARQDQKNAGTPDVMFESTGEAGQNQGREGMVTFSPAQRSRRISAGDVPLLSRSRSNSCTPPHGYSV